MSLGSQGYLGELYIENSDSLINSSFVRIGVITEFTLKIMVQAKDISTIGSLTKNKYFRNFETNFKSWNVSLKKILVDNELSDLMLSEAIDNGTKLWLKIIPKKLFGANNLRTVFIGRALIVSQSIKNSLTSVVDNALQLIGSGSIFIFKEDIDKKIYFNSACAEAALANGCNFQSLEWTDLYTSISCSGGWSDPVYISTANLPAQEWIESSCIASYRKSAGYFGCGLGSAPSTQTSSPPQKPTIAVPPACITAGLASFVGKTYGLAGFGGAFDTNVSYPNSQCFPAGGGPVGAGWFPSSPAVRAPFQIVTATQPTCALHWLVPHGGSNPPSGFGNNGAIVPGYEKLFFDTGKCELLTDMRTNILALPVGAAGNCLVDSNLVTFGYKSIGMIESSIVNPTLSNISIDAKIEFFSDSLGANLLGTFNMVRKVNRTGLWDELNINGSVPIGTRYFRAWYYFNNPDQVGHLYAFICNGTMNGLHYNEMGMRFFY